MKYFPAASLRTLSALISAATGEQTVARNTKTSSQIFSPPAQFFYQQNTLIYVLTNSKTLNPYVHCREEACIGKYFPSNTMSVFLIFFPDHTDIAAITFRFKSELFVGWMHHMMFTLNLSTSLLVLVVVF